MAGENPRAAQFVDRLMKTGGGQVSSPGFASGPGPSRYVTDGPTKALYDAQFRLMDDKRWAETFFGSREAMQDWVDAALRQVWPFHSGPLEPVRVVLHDSATFAYSSGRIYAPRSVKASWRGLHLTHELAHYYGEPTGHGLLFVRTMVGLMEGLYGKRTTDLFRKFLTAEGVQL